MNARAAIVVACRASKLSVSDARARGVDLRIATDAASALRLLADARPAAIVSDDSALLDRARSQHPGISSTLVSDEDTEGLAPPLDLDAIVRLALRAEAERESTRALEELVGESPPMQQLRKTLARAAPSDATVLLRGESGTGKELAARALHAGSARASGPFISVNAAALPDSLLESELFGHEKGAFTGALAKRPGRVERARGGTLFLDEIGDVSAACQVKLLRLLQEREYEPLGATSGVAADVRFVAATHRDLEAMVKSGELRQDLFYRLNVVSVWLPPLRARRSDVPELARRFVRELGARHGKPGLVLDDDAAALLAKERWPGNVRQLQNLVERVVVLGEGPTVRAPDIRAELAEGAAMRTEVTGTTLAPGDAIVPLTVEVRAAEGRAIERALRHTKGNRALAARLLGVSRATLYNKLAELGLG